MLRHGTTFIPILSRKKLVILSTNGEKRTWKSLELREKTVCPAMSLKTARTEYIRKLIDNHQNNPRFLFSTVARLTNKQMSPNLNIPSQFNSNDFMNFFTEKNRIPKKNCIALHLQSAGLRPQPTPVLPVHTRLYSYTQLQCHRQIC